MRHARTYAGAVALVLAAAAACRDEVRPVTAPTLTPGEAPQLFLNNPTPGNPFTQCGNIDTFCTWEFGNINPSKALMHEGDATPFRQVINDDPNAASSSDGAPNTLYEVQISYKTRHGGKNAYDFLTRWDVSEGSEFHPVANPGGSPNPKLKANLCIPPNGEAATSNLCSASGSTGSLQNAAEVAFIEIPIPFAAGDPKQANVLASTHSAAATRVITVFNAKGATDIVQVGNPTLTYSGGETDDAQFGILTFRFRTGSAARAGNFLIAWGGHIAQQSVWGEGTGAASISGSPYHMQVNYIKRLNANGTDCGSICVLLSGSRDLQMSANVVQAAPNLSLTKTPSVSQVCTGSSTAVTYTYVVTNTGNVAISGTVVDDAGTPGESSDDFTVGTFSNLGVGASATLTATRTISGTTVNTATATIAGTTISRTATATVTGVACSILVDKTVDRTSVCTSAGQVTYTYVITNTGDVDLTNVTLQDDKLGTITLQVSSLAKGASTTATKTTTLSQTGTVTNVATARGTAFGGTTAEYNVSDTDDATVTVGQCSIVVDKTVDKANVCSQNGAVTYTYVVTNNGTSALTNVVVSDDRIAIPNGTIGDLAAGASVTRTATTTLATPGTVTNTATATGTAVDGATVTDTDDAVVNVLRCTIDVTKTPSVTSVCNANASPVTYSFVVTNTGNAPLTGVTLVDDKLGAITLSKTTLAPGETATGSGSATLTATTTNKGTATGTALDGTAATSVSDEATATVTALTCSITVDKTVDRTSVCSQNGAVTYTYVVTNSGTSDLTNVVVSDDRIAIPNGTIGNLAAGASVTRTATTTLGTVGTVVNTATATGTAVGGVSVTDTDDATVNVLTCSLSVTKAPDRLTICEGVSTVVTYTYVVTNTGSATVDNLALTDDKLGTVTLPVSSLASGASATVTKAGTLTQSTTNVASVTGTALGGTVAATPVSSSATSSVVALQCGRGQIAPTQTTCEQFRDGTSPSEPFLAAQLRNGAISQVNPGVVFYYGTVTVPAGGNQTLRVIQSDVPAAGSPLPLLQVSADNAAELYTGTCSARVAFFTLSNFQPTALSVAPGSYIVRIKYAPNSLVGAPATANQFPVNYRWQMTLDNGLPFSQANVDLQLKNP